VTLKLGLIGFSEGNAHPYSWSAICNGYSVSQMRNCGFPEISQYLGAEVWPLARIYDVKVTHVWTQDNTLSQHIARASYIPNIVDDPFKMIGEIDALLLARDDAENHLKFAKPFLEFGMPIYIDKPLATSIEGLNSLYDLEKYPGQLFTCSALRYASELCISSEDRKKLGQIKSIEAITPNSWIKYSIHIIEPVLNMLDVTDTVENNRTESLQGDGVKVSIEYRSGVLVHLTASGAMNHGPISIKVIGQLSSKVYTFVSTFSAFKLALSDFLSGVKSRTCKSPRDYNERVISVIEMGL